jgi:hypothetical protein
MLKKTIRYTDFNDQEVVEDFYFHLSKADLVALELSYKGGLYEHIRAIVASEDGAGVVDVINRLVLDSYGKKSEDGRRFIKTQDLRDEFMSSPAYSELFMELCTNAEEQARFISGVVPAGLQEELANITASKRADELHTRVTASQNGEDPPKPDSTVLTAQEIVEMEPDELRSGLATGRYKLTP